jgi:hypothetical protein
MADTYKIVRSFERTGKRRVIVRGLSLQDAQAHCKDPETSSSTCKKVAGHRRTLAIGRWFDGYEKE